MPHFTEQLVNTPLNFDLSHWQQSYNSSLWKNSCNISTLVFYKLTRKSAYVHWKKHSFFPWQEQRWHILSFPCHGKIGWHRGLPTHLITVVKVQVPAWPWIIIYVSLFEVLFFPIPQGFFYVLSSFPPSAKI